MKKSTLTRFSHLMQKVTQNESLTEDYKIFRKKEGETQLHGLRLGQERLDLHAKTHDS
jgi:hypothetical protein